MKEGVTVINTMADGTVCNDLSTYLKSPNQLPEVTKRLILKFMEDGYRIMEKRRKQSRAGVSRPRLNRNGTSRRQEGNNGST